MAGVEDGRGRQGRGSANEKINQEKHLDTSLVSRPRAASTFFRRGGYSCLLLTSV